MSEPSHEPCPMCGTSDEDRKCNFKEISKLLNKSEATLKMAWKRCKLKGDKALEESIL